MACSPHDLRDYFFGELSREEHRAVEAHASVCAACREELESLRLTQSALLSVRDEEPPRRIAFVSDKIFEPNWWQRLWHSGPKLGFASAAMLSAAILVHAFYPPAPPAATPAPVAQVQPASAPERQFTQAEVDGLVRASVAQAVAESESRQEQRLQQALSRQQRDFDLQHKATLAAVEDQFSYYQKRMNVLVRAANELPGEPQ